MGDWLFGWVYELFYILQKSICYLLDFIREIFFKLAGIETVSIDGGQEEILTHFIKSDGVRNAFWGVFLVGVILLFVFVLIAVVKSETADIQHKKTKGQILVKAMQSFVTFLIIPFLLIAGIALANVVVQAIHASMTGAMVDGNTTSLIGGQILVTSGCDAYIGPADMRLEIERKFITGELDYNNLSVVKDYYKLGDLNFFVGIAGGLVVLVMFVISAVMFVQRIFDIILLYIVSPASVSTIPLDDGGRFRIWREMLVSKVLGAYGIILSMNIFFLIVPQISQVAFFGNSFKNGIVQLLFIIGGAFAITKANMVIAQLTGSNAGMQESQQMLSNIQSGIHMARAAGHVVGGAAGMILGGTDYLRNRKHGATISENLSSAIHSQRNRKEIGTDGFDDTNGLASLSSGTGEHGSNLDRASNDLNDNLPRGNDINETNSKSSVNGSALSDSACSDSENGMAKIDNGDNVTAATSNLDNFANASDTASTNTPKEKSGVTFGSIVKGSTRLATLPAGVLKDLIQGGVIVAGKNFVPRVKNVLKGNSVVNHADISKSLRSTAKHDASKESKK